MPNHTDVSRRVVWLQVTWHPFQLNPALPQDDSGRNKLAYYKEKFGDARTQQMLPRMTVRVIAAVDVH